MKEKTINILFIIAVLALSLMARIELLPIKSGDWYCSLSVWMGKIQELGAWNSLGVRVSDYTSSYMYLLCLVSGFSNSLYAIKIVSIIFDYAAGIAMFFLVRQLTGSPRKSIAAFALTLLCPTILINSAWWCNCDMTYAFFLIMTLLSLFKDKGALCCIMFGIAYSFKQQSVFLLPFLIILCVKGKTIKPWHFLWIPVVFFLIQIPAWIAGRPLGELLSVYFIQMGEYPFGTMNYPNLYELLDENVHHWHHMPEISGFALYFAFGVLGIFAWLLCTRSFKLTPEIMISIALLSVGLTIYTLPHMHERYSFMLDILAIVYALQRPSKAPVSLAYITISLISYMCFLNGIYVIPFVYLSVALLALHTYVGMDLARQIKAAGAPSIPLQH
ncbi:MAG: hypothetical protein J6X69_02640 [Bacteroidales bacterium]|nr:hypothetical protein [Bacteroidales bacterium]